MTITINSSDDLNNYIISKDDSPVMFTGAGLNDCTNEQLKKLQAKQMRARRVKGRL